MPPVRQVRASSREQRVELAFAVEGIEVVAAADVALADPDLRNRVASPGFGAHLGAQRAFADVDLLEGGDALLAEQLLGHVAVRAEASRVDGNLGHGI